jgi:hypothetical protein
VGSVKTQAQLGLADVAHLLGPGGCLSLKRATLLLDVLQDVDDLEWGLDLVMLRHGAALAWRPSCPWLQHCQLLVLHSPVARI